MAHADAARTSPQPPPAPPLHVPPTTPGISTRATPNSRAPRPAIAGQAAVVVILLSLGSAAIPSPAAQPASRQRADEHLRTLNTANGLLGRGLYDLAAPEYEKFLDAAPDHASAPIAHYGLAVCLHRLGRAEEAADHLEVIAGDASFEFAAEVDLLLATCRMSRAEFDRAADSLRRMTRAFPSHASIADARAMLVECLSRLGEHEPAAREARTFAQSYPDSPLRERTDLFLALSELNLGRDEQAQRVLESSLNRFPDGALADQATLLLAQCRHRRGLLGEAIDAYETLAARVRGPLAADALLGLGQIALAQGRLDDAASALDTLLREHADAPSAPAAVLARARVSLEQDDAPAARSRLEALARVGDDALADDLAYWLAKCDLRQGRPEDALERLRRAAEEYPDSQLAPEIAYDTAIALLRLGDDPAANQALDAFREAFPAHALAGDALATQAGVLHRLEDYDGSRALCEQFLREHASSPRTPEIEFLAAENRYLAGDYARADRAYRQFLERRGAAPDQSDRAEAARFRIAMSAYRQERADEAEPLLDAIVTGGPLRLEFAGALLALGDIRFQRGAWPDAEAALRRYLDLGPSLPGRDDALMKLGLCLARQGQHEAALAALDDLQRQHPESVHALQARFEQGQSLLALGRDAEARAALESVLSAERESRFAPHALLALGTIARREGRTDDAARLLAQAGALGGEDIAADADLQRAEALLAAGDHAAAATVLSAFLDAHPDHEQATPARARLVIAQARAGDHQAALTTYAALGRRASTLETPTRHAMLFEVAWANRALARNADAVRILQSLLDDAPEPALAAHVLLALGGLAIEEGDAEQGTALLDRALVAGLETGQAQVVEQASYRLGACRLEAESFQQAADTLARFETDFPASDLRPSALLLRGEALLRAGRVEQAAACLQRVIDEHADSPQSAPALLRLGEATAALQLWARSQDAFERWLDNPPTDDQGGDLWFQARFGLGWACENQGRYDDAMREYARVVTDHEGPTAARAQFQIGQCLFALERHDDAVRELLKVDILYAYPEWSAAALYEAGRCLVAAGRAAEARQQFEAVRTRFAESSWANLAAQRLAEVNVGSVPGR